MSSLTQQVLNSSALIISTRFIQRTIGLVSTLILARLLVPNDFGVVAFLSITLNLFQILSQVGSQQYIISRETVEPEDLNTAWTLTIGLRCCFWIVLLLLAPQICAFFNMQQALSGLYFISIILIINAFFNPGFWLYRREFKYKKVFLLEISTKIFSFLIVISIALYKPTFWALLIGDVLAALFSLLLSYLLHSFRPKFSICRFTQQWAFSKWVFAKGILGFTNQQIDILFVSKFFSAPQLGGFHLSKDMALLPATQIITPASEPILASLAKVANAPQDFAYHFRLVMMINILMALPICLFMTTNSELIIEVILGEKWRHISSIFSAFCILLFSLSIESLLTNTFIVKRKVKSLFNFNLIAILLALPVLFYVSNYSLEILATARGVLHLFVAMLMIGYLNYCYKLQLKRVFILIIPIILSTFLSGIIFEFLKPLLLTSSALLNLISYTLCFFFIFCSIQISFYLIHYNRYREHKHFIEIIQYAYKKVCTSHY
ncbi:oligosaccharide flippase family protein [Thalassotalea psychrophila]|uniref:Oligosaccharide flippase family protein n=1 Tax=Thalassotalea psychrophila TaxID=3065647 RepID=A0ABY9TUZ2_9GAMM|nr:oligosaccharide flippase family protein [Colwelliaceae bacterium SQ149]